MRETVTEAATVEEAITSALAELGLPKEDVSYEVLAEPGKGFLGLTSKRVARVRMWATADAPETPPAVSDAEGSAGPEEESFAADHEADHEGLVGPGGATMPLDVRSPGNAADFDDSEPISDDELDKIADAAVDTVKEILKGFDIEATIDEYEGDQGEIILDVVNGDLAILIGRHGRTLDAFQTLVTAITNRKIEHRYPVLIDVEGYRSRRKVKLEETARTAADRARRSGRDVRLRPMSSYERKIVHMALRNDERVTTASEGEDPFRRVVVSPR